MSSRKAPATSGDHAEAFKTDVMGRKIWDKTHFAILAAERASGELQRREEEEAEAKLHKKRIGSPKEHLQQRAEELRLEKEIGKQRIVSATAPEEAQGGFFCNVCECLLKDSASYLDHLNGKKHNRTLGMSMRVKKSTKQDVAERVRLMKQKRDLLKSKT